MMEKMQIRRKSGQPANGLVEIQREGFVSLVISFGDYLQSLFHPGQQLLAPSSVFPIHSYMNKSVSWLM